MATPMKSAVEGHAAFPDPKHAERLGQDPLGAVEQHPAEATAGDDAHGAVENEIVHLHRRPGRARARRAAPGEEPAREETDQIHEAIPPHVQWTEREGDGIGVGVDEHRLFIYYLSNDATARLDAALVNATLALRVIEASQGRGFEAVPGPGFEAAQGRASGSCSRLRREIYRREQDPNPGLMHRA